MNSKKWKHLSIAECAEVVGGGTPSSKMKEYWGGTIPWITPKDLSNNSTKYITRGERNITEDGLNNSSANLLPPYSLLFSSRAPVGLLAINKNPVTTNQGFKSLVPKKNFDVEFLYYLLKEKKNFIISRATGSTFQEISGTILKELSFDIPDLKTQKKISNILNTIDKQIEINTQIIQSFERISKIIFKLIFTNFDMEMAKIDEYENKFYENIGKIFPIEFDKNELEKNLKDWKSGKIKDLVDHSKINILPEQFPKESFLHYSIPAFDDNQKPVKEFGGDIKSNKTLVVPNSILVSKLNPDNPRIWIIDKNMSLRQICSTEFLVLVPKKNICLSYIWSLFLDTKLQARIKSLVTGTSKSHQRVKPLDILNLEIIIPPKVLRDLFDQISRPMMEYIAQSKKENINLSELRDVILPKLVSGEIYIDQDGKIIKKENL